LLARRTICRAEEGNNSTLENEGSTGSNNIVGSVGLFALWAALIGYAFFWAPNQTPLRDQYFLEKFLNLTNDGVSMNAVFTQLFYIMGVWPLIYTALLVPAGKSRNGVPAWPFFSGSYAFGEEIHVFRSIMHP